MGENTPFAKQSRKKEQTNCRVTTVMIFKWGQSGQNYKKVYVNLRPERDSNLGSMTLCYLNLQSRINPLSHHSRIHKRGMKLIERYSEPLKWSQQFLFTFFRLFCSILWPTMSLKITHVMQCGLEKDLASIFITWVTLEEMIQSSQNWDLVTAAPQTDYFIL